MVSWHQLQLYIRMIPDIIKTLKVSINNLLPCCSHYLDPNLSQSVICRPTFSSSLLLPPAVKVITTSFVKTTAATYVSHFTTYSFLPPHNDLFHATYLCLCCLRSMSNNLFNSSGSLVSLVHFPQQKTRSLGASPPQVVTVTLIMFQGGTC